MTTTEKPKAETTQAFETRLEDVRRRFQKMELEQMKKGEVEARAVLARAQKRFEGRRADVESRLKKARGASGSAWDEIRKGLEEAYTSLEDSLERARAEFAGESVDDDEEETDEDT
jgi:hypothetical protein